MWTAWARSPSSGCPTSSGVSGSVRPLVPAARAGAGVGPTAVEAVAGPRRRPLAPYKRPKQYVVLDELPRTATGKLQRRLIPARVDPTWSPSRGRTTPAPTSTSDRSGAVRRILERMSPVDAGPPIATVNPVNGELLQSFEPFDAAGWRPPGHRGDGGAGVGHDHLRRAVPSC